MSSEQQEDADMLNPGSDSAREKGCKCPVTDNHHGKGRGGDGVKYGWYMSGNCPIHAAEIQEPLR